jgi:hypothetical protein
VLALPQLPFANAAAYAGYLQQVAQRRGVAYHCAASSRYEVSCHGLGYSNGVQVVTHYWKIGPHTVRICLSPAAAPCVKKHTTAAGV